MLITKQISHTYGAILRGYLKVDNLSENLEFEQQDLCLSATWLLLKAAIL
jgi:hypothetical protein